MTLWRLLRAKRNLVQSVRIFGIFLYKSNQIQISPNLFKNDITDTKYCQILWRIQWYKYKFLQIHLRDPKIPKYKFLWLFGTPNCQALPLTIKWSGHINSKDYYTYKSLFIFLLTSHTWWIRNVVGYFLNTLLTLPQMNSLPSIYVISTILSTQICSLTHVVLLTLISHWSLMLTISPWNHWTTPISPPFWW